MARVLVNDTFYGTEVTYVHDRDFGGLAADAGMVALDELKRAGIEAGTVVDLGCGSGILGAIVGSSGYDVFGVDISADMLERARVNAPAATLVLGSLHDVELPPAVAVCAIGETLNYTVDPQAGLTAVAALAARVHAVLPGGAPFIFDVATPGRAGPGGRVTQWFDRGDYAMSVRVSTSEDGTVLTRAITAFSRVPDGSYRRSDERHVLRLYEPEVIAELVAAAGFEVERRDAYGASPAPSPDGWQVFIGRRR